LFAALYGELHRMAQRELARRGAAVTLSATTLVHEAYLDIAGRQRAVFADRKSFMVYASRVMRGLIIDYARGRLAQKRGAQFEFVPVTAEVVDALPDRTDLTRISDALDALTTVDPRLALVVDLKFFCGFSLIEIARMQGISESTAQREWQKARIYLRLALEGADDGSRP
jgi:RNA polymerase sigma factor (TIGR02999 family)